jgi:hypothetical protein
LIFDEGFRSQCTSGRAHRGNAGEIWINLSVCSVVARPCLRPGRPLIFTQKNFSPRLQVHNQAMSLDEKPWTFEHSTECGVPVEFAWQFWTNVSNWAIDADVESLEIDGPFAAGSRGFTNSRSSGRIEWRIAEVHPGRAVIEFPLAGAVGRFVWTFKDLGGGRTRMTQRCTIDGEQAAAYANAIGPSLEAGIPAGMQKLCETMENSHVKRAPGK